MNCPQCGKKGLRVINSRTRNESVYRRRECVACSFRFSTTEISMADYQSLQSCCQRICQLQQILKES
ncbi:NrdR family transcriptional regulator [Acidithiobacillus thiooxidans]|uniref:NrdR family transcriptional regulator n=1 Tax=Acidithiobacillus thiooxidans TaxID=930 RepID=UPI0035B5F902